jgi:hypothetical protein
MTRGAADVSRKTLEGVKVGMVKHVNFGRFSC